MKAIVCDCCGKTTLLPDEMGWHGKELGVYKICSPDFGSKEADLCEECFDKFFAALRKETE